jgi:hypothetical protein
MRITDGSSEFYPVPALTNNLKHVSHVVEDNKRIAEHEHRLGKLQLIVNHAWNRRLEVFDALIGDVAYGSSGETGKASGAVGCYFRHLSLYA